jgi:hypothetical protein
VPNTLQYPLERHRDVARRWERLLRQTAAPKDCGAFVVKPLINTAIDTAARGTDVVETLSSSRVAHHAN